MIIETDDGTLNTHTGEFRRKRRPELVRQHEEAIQLVREAFDHFSLNHSLVDVRDWMKSARALLDWVDGR